MLLDRREVALWVERCWVEEPAGSGGTARRRMHQILLEDGRRCRLAQGQTAAFALAPAQSRFPPRVSTFG